MERPKPPTLAERLAQLRQRYIAQLAQARGLAHAAQAQLRAHEEAVQQLEGALAALGSLEREGIVPAIIGDAPPAPPATEPDA